MKVIARPARQSGISLLDVVVAMGVLAVAIPGAFLAFRAAGESRMMARAETRAPWIARYCSESIPAAERGKNAVFGFTADGVFAEKGMNSTNKDVYYYAKFHLMENNGNNPAVKLEVSFPASASGEKRRKFDFYVAEK